MPMSGRSPRDFEPSLPDPFGASRSLNASTAARVTASTRHRLPKLENTFSGPKDLSSNEYREFLVARYGLERNEIVGKFIFVGKTFESLEDVLLAAHLHETEGKLSPSSPSALHDEILAVGKMQNRNDFTLHGDGRVVVYDPKTGLGKVYPSMSAARSDL